MNVLIIGSGGREHTFAWKIAQSIKCKDLYVAPGNGGTSKIAKNVAISENNFEAIAQFIAEKEINMLVVGPEAPLVDGIRDFFESKEEFKNLLIVGPGKKGAKLEGSKDFTKAFLQKNNIPTAKYTTFTNENYEDGLKYISAHQLPIVLKADGLAAGKGVVIAQNHQEALETFEQMIKNLKFGDASKKVVIEEFLQGIELSVFVLTDGNSYIILPEAKDYKRIGEADTGLNTGGMGAISPVPFAHSEFMDKVEQSIIIPTIEGLKKENIPYQGFLFIGLMNVDGNPYVIEYNVRMGDPETEVVLPRIKNDFLELLEITCKGNLSTINLQIDENYATTVIMVSGGYPNDYEKGKIINGLDESHQAIIFHAGTKTENAEIFTNGGRVIACTGIGKNMQEALEASYSSAQKIHYEKAYYRKDIGFDLR